MNMNKITLKIWILNFFFGVALMLHGIFMAMTHSPFYFILAFIMFVWCLAVYYLVLKEEFEKMQEEYEEAGSLKKTVKKWKGDDTE